MQISFINKVGQTARIPRAVILHLADIACANINKKENSKKLLSVVFVSRAESKKLNCQYRRQAKPTNVLSFLSDNEDELGDIIICSSIARQEALKQEVGVNKRITYLFVHGFLHLSGYDHKTTKQAEKMEETAERILGAIG